MPSALLYLGIMLVVICFWFVLLKRPVYEAVLLSFIVLLTVTGSWGNVLGYIDGALSTSLLYSMTTFVAMSIILGFNGGDYAYQMANAALFFLVAVAISLLQLSLTRGRNTLS